ncbi:uncharacterized protein TRIADDRAFT_58970 [Trichoplax adhaerens]|uniref:UBX domain-containing protein n=1 Tax=Trichoplax adhaerens TaxID=10228 RepID=B3S466_TRIAD|nr:hypothetical protein TRIADDRAFT_58970 [Trichoplax adhaerens]EDV22401.1 hypothetical protein TRIADDRAFT_58970 [Trichoplax adhaerens]|eukprot:XP_002114945.1 hypothetical protein TRIADDRAFT_58970 [Trichoplax adhaerens]
MSLIKIVVQSDARHEHSLSSNNNVDQPNRFDPSTHTVHLLIGRRATGDRRQVVNSIAFLEAFQRDFGERCPTFYRGSYKQAVNSAKEGLQFLLVYIHSRMHQDTDTFCREVLCNEQFVEFINNNQVLTWGGDVDTYEGYREACEALRPATFPFLAVISQRDNKMVVVKRIEGLLELDEVVAMLKQTFEDNEPYLVVARDERNQRITNQLLREQQDAAYQESLRADQEKERIKRAESERLEKEREEENRKAKEAEEKLERYKSERIMRANRVPAEPTVDDPNAVRIIIKFPSGSRLERRFSTKDTLETLYDYIHKSDEVPMEFVIVTNFPRKTLTYDPDSTNIPTLEELGITRPSMLFIQDETDD